MVNIFATLYAFFVNFSFCSLLLWQKMLTNKYTNISIIMIIIIMIMHLVILNYVNKMLLDYNNNRKNFTTLMKNIDFLMLFFHQREA
jgi:hypothetical protein